MFRVASEDNQRDKFQVLSDIQKLLEIDLLSNETRANTHTGWSIITKVAILLHCVKALAFNNQVYFMGMELGPIKSLALNCLHDINTFEMAESEIKTTMRRLPVGAVVLFYPSSKCEFCDAILVYKLSSKSLEQIVIQCNLEKQCSKGERILPSWITKAILIPGNIPKEPDAFSRNDVEIDSRWKCLTRTEIDSLLGHSLMHLYPELWKSSMNEN
jgi:hypothetical protein